VKINEMKVKNTKRRGAGPTALIGSITAFTDDDQRFLTAWLDFHRIAPEVFDIAEMICSPGSAAAEELEDLLRDSMAES
jgi:hypothetical protein